MNGMDRLIKPPAQSPREDELVLDSRPLLVLHERREAFPQIRAVLVGVAHDRDVLGSCGLARSALLSLAGTR